MRKAERATTRHVKLRVLPASAAMFPPRDYGAGSPARSPIEPVWFPGIPRSGGPRASGSSGLQSGRPFRVGRVSGQVPVEIRRAVFPPDRTAFAQGDLSRVDGFSRGTDLAVPAFRLFHGTPSIHQIRDEPKTTLLRDGRVRRSPQPAGDQEVSTIRGRRKGAAAQSGYSRASRS